ncbi:hypothetical protein [Mangrovimonas aestuarii]|uniref:hypothetical protein n=1 Tax=Mangrovimonas aestuarii TaxID=3018443 RepID=UPI002377D7E3|nr:hypothetical protein [Mangrovimonas aestuarii]
MVYRLPFASITLIEDDIAEVVIDEGVELAMEEVEAYHEFLTTYLKAPFSLLINKKHSYSYTFEAQQNICDIKEIRAMAVVVNNVASELATLTLSKINEHKEWNMLLFNNKADAKDWLYGEQGYSLKEKTSAIALH